MDTAEDVQWTQKEQGIHRISEERDYEERITPFPLAKSASLKARRRKSRSDRADDSCRGGHLPIEAMGGGSRCRGCRRLRRETCAETGWSLLRAVEASFAVEKLLELFAKRRKGCRLSIFPDVAVEPGASSVVAASSASHKEAT